MTIIRWAFLVMAVALAGSAQAGDFASREIIGFSPDGRYFAFEEYGVQDGSGFPYANIYVIDTTSDRWVPDTPKRVQVNDETAQLADVRAEARQQARLLIQQYAISEPGQIVATNLYTHLSATPYQVTVNPRLVAPPIDEHLSLSIDQYKVVADPVCAGMGSGDTKGFRLTLQRNEASRVLHEDKDRIPSSRSCPLDYRIHDVVTYFAEPRGAITLAVIVQIIQIGFEGPDGRFIAVTGRVE